MEGDFAFRVWSTLEEGLILIGETTHELLEQANTTSFYGEN